VGGLGGGGGWLGGRRKRPKKKKTPSTETTWQGMRMGLSEEDTSLKTRIKRCSQGIRPQSNCALKRTLRDDLVKPLATFSKDHIRERISFPQKEKNTYAEGLKESESWRFGEKRAAVGRSRELRGGHTRLLKKKSSKREGTSRLKQRSGEPLPKGSEGTSSRDQEERLLGSDTTAHVVKGEGDRKRVGADNRVACWKSPTKRGSREQVLYQERGRALNKKGWREMHDEVHTARASSARKRRRKGNSQSFNGRKRNSRGKIGKKKRGEYGEVAEEGD